MSTEVRTRFAPSPTGYMHIGNLRTALYAYLIAKHYGGKFILRIEDTDVERQVDGAVEIIYQTLRSVGLHYDEGPDAGGEYGPYIQSRRRAIYQEHARALIAQGDAYYCFCTKERLDAARARCDARKVPYRYDGHCRELGATEVAERLGRGEACVIRQKTPELGVTRFEDAVFGHIAVNNDTLDDNILIKSDGLPTYNFANVIDDHLMRISHVIRGNEYLSSTPKYNLLYKALGWEIPVYIHLPLIMRPDGRKLSKRMGDPSFEDLYQGGYLKEAILNYIVLLGWNPGTEEEFFSLDELITRFSIEGLSKSQAIFDLKKLRWMNGIYLRKLSPDAFHEAAWPYWRRAVTGPGLDPRKISRLMHVRTEVLAEIPEQLDFIDTLPDYDRQLFVHKKMGTTLEISLKYLEISRELLRGLEPWEEAVLHGTLMDLIAREKVKNGQVLWPLRTALSGKPFTPGGAIEILDILGREESLRRIEIGIAKLKT